MRRYEGDLYRAMVPLGRDLHASADMRSDMDTDQTRELAVGDPAPDFHLPASSDREIALADYRGRAHVVLFFVRTYQ
jgi:AhpC/TSA family